MIRVLENLRGEKENVGCIGCAIEKGELKNNILIFQSKHFTVAQNFEIPIPGFLILSTKRHVNSFIEFNQGEKDEFIDVLIKTRSALKDVMKVDIACVYQEEDAFNHFHIWMFPKYGWMKKFGRGIESIRPIMEYAKANMKTKDSLNEVKNSLEKLKDYFSKK